MKSVNKVILMGAVGKDPEIRYTAEGLAIASFSLATSEKRKDKEEVTQWHNCVAFGKLAEIVEKFIRKGSKLYLEGTIQYQQYEKEGEKRYSTKIIVNDVSMLSTKEDSLSSSETCGTVVNLSGAVRKNEEFQDDDIPF